MRAASAGYGDIPLHMTQVSKFAFQKNLDLNEPIFNGEKIRYSFLINLISGFILRLFGNWYFAMQFPAMALMTASTLLMFLSYRKFIKSEWVALVAIVIFLFGSGFGASYVIKNYEQSLNTQSRTFTGYLVDTTASTVTKWDAVYPNQNIAWGAPLSLVFLHQRSFFLGFFLFTLFWYLFTIWIKNPKNTRLTIAIGLIVGLGPLSHFHSFVAMILVLAAILVRALILKDRTLVKRMLILGIVAGIVATPQIIYLVAGKTSLAFSDNPFIKFRLGWMVEPTTGSVVFKPYGRSLFGDLGSFFKFLWINFAVVLPFLVMTFLVSVKSEKFRSRFLGISLWCILALLFFAVVQIIRFQPWDYDNNKILVYMQFFAAPAIVAFFAWLKDHQKVLGSILFATFVIIAIHSGVLDQVPRALVPYGNLPVIFNTDVIIMSDYIKRNIDEKEIILTSSTHLNPVNSLAGRPVIVGYPGWLWTRGISYVKEENDLKNFYYDPISNFDIASKYGAKYVLIDSTAIYDWKAQVNKFDTNFNLLLSQGEFRLYQIK